VDVAARSHPNRGFRISVAPDMQVERDSTLFCINRGSNVFWARYVIRRCRNREPATTASSYTGCAGHHPLSFSYGWTQVRGPPSPDTAAPSDRVSRANHCTMARPVHFPQTRAPVGAVRGAASCPRTEPLVWPYGWTGPPLLQKSSSYAWPFNKLSCLHDNSRWLT
jgi:hypothetical protein